METRDDRKPLGGGWWVRPRVLDLTPAMQVDRRTEARNETVRRWQRFAAAAKVPELREVPR